MENLLNAETILANWPALIENFLRFFGLSVTGGAIIWSIVQVAMVGLAFSLAFVAAKIATPAFEGWISAARLRPVPLRASAIILRRLQPLFFSIFLWLGVAAMRAATWDSHAYFVNLAASLMSTWVVISIASRMIRNRSVARLVEVGAWILVTLSLLGILPQATRLLDSLAFQINTLRISLLTLVQGAVVLTVLFWAAGMLGRLLDRQLSTLEDISPTMRVLVGKIGRFLLAATALLIGLYAIGVDFSALTFISGAVGLGLGFGLQKVVSNLVSGIILLLDKSIKPGDVITVGDTFGWITSLNARYASVSMRDGREILIPNEDLITQQVQNWSFADPYVRIDINFGVSYDADPHLVRNIAVEAASKRQRVTVGNKEYPVVCHVTGFGESSIDFVLRFFISDPVNGLTNIRGEVFLALWDAFKLHNIVIPYPHRELIMKSGKVPETPDN